jgi:hypothetical protein
MVVVETALPIVAGHARRPWLFLKVNAHQTILKDFGRKDDMSSS